jgi:hypothetical protein
MVKILQVYIIWPQELWDYKLNSYISEGIYVDSLSASDQTVYWNNLVGNEWIFSIKLSWFNLITTIILTRGSD